MSAVLVELNLFPAIAAKLGAEAHVAEEDAARAWAEAASAAAPVLTGALAASGHAEGNEVVFDAVNEQGDPYGVYVEFGTHNAPAQPFLRPTEDAGAVVLERDLATALEV
jgi:HK97 gp10 family phage protein